MALVLFRYPSEKLSTARRALMAPYPPGGEAEAFLYAFSECDHGLRDVHADDLDDSARSWFRTIRETMDTTGIEDPSGRGTFLIKAERLTFDQKHAFSSALDELASWFNRRFWTA
jgi:hypothetical protein